MAQALGHTHALLPLGVRPGDAPADSRRRRGPPGPRHPRLDGVDLSQVPARPGLHLVAPGRHLLGLDSRRVTTAWIALTDSTVDNGCMRVVPGSHRRPILPHRDTYAAGQPAEPGPGDRGARSNERRRGGRGSPRRRDVAPPRQHHPRLQPEPVRTARGSASLRASRRPRRGRSTASRPPPVLARGQDRHGHFRYSREPPTLGFEEALAAQQADGRPVPLRDPEDAGHYAAGDDGD